MSSNTSLLIIFVCRSLPKTLSTPSCSTKFMIASSFSCFCLERRTMVFSCVLQIYPIQPQSQLTYHSTLKIDQPFHIVCWSDTAISYNLHGSKAWQKSHVSCSVWWAARYWLLTAYVMEIAALDQVIEARSVDSRNSTVTNRFRPPNACYFCLRSPLLFKEQERRTNNLLEHRVSRSIKFTTDHFAMTASFARQSIVMKSRRVALTQSGQAEATSLLNSPTEYWR